MPPPASADRDAVHDELTVLLSDGGALHWDSPGDPLFDDDVIAEVAHEYRNAHVGPVTIGGAVAVYTAGPPGAGKSTTMGGLDVGYRRIDPDEIKDLLLARAIGLRLFDDAEGTVLLDGRGVMARELSGRVHEASTDVANQVRAVSMGLRENICIEGTMTWDGLAELLADELAENSYEQMRVVDVEVPASVAIERARARWWFGRWHEPLGGRFMSDEAVRRSYQDSRWGDTMSQCADVAADLFERAHPFLEKASLERFVLDEHGAQQFFARTADDGVVVYDGIPA